MNNQLELSQSIYLDYTIHSQETKLAQLFSQKSCNFIDENQLLFQNFEGFPEWNDLLQLYLELETAHSSYKQMNNGKWKPWDHIEIKMLNIIGVLYCSGRCLNPLLMNKNDWDQISQIMFDRHWKICRSKWLEGKAKSVIDRPWRKEEDEMLSLLFEQNQNVNKVNKWKEISIELSRVCKTPYVRMGKQCRERWMNKLNPEVVKGPWYKEEDLILLQNILKYGKKWSLISRSCYGKQKTENSLKNRYHTILKRESSKLINFRQERNQSISEQEIVLRIINKLNSDQKVNKRIYQIDQFNSDYSADCNNFHLVVIKKNKIQVLQI